MREPLTCESVARRGWVERYVAGRLSEAETEAFEGHFVTCTRCQSELKVAAAVRAVLPEVRRSEDPGATRIEGRVVGWIHRHRGIAATAAALAAIFVGILLVQPEGEVILPHRETTPETAGVPQPQAPVGDIAALQEFRWSAVQSADLYRVSLYDDAGKVIWRADTRDSRILPPDTLELQPGSLYLWLVEARVSWNRWMGSPIVRFTVADPRRDRRP